MILSLLLAAVGVAFGAWSYSHLRAAFDESSDSSVELYLSLGIPGAAVCLICLGGALFLLRHR